MPHMQPAVHCTKKGRQLHSAPEPSGKRNSGEGYKDASNTSHEGDRSFSECSDDSCLKCIEESLLLSYVNSSLQSSNSSPQRHQTSKCAPHGQSSSVVKRNNKCTGYAVVPEITPPDAKALPLPMFLRTGNAAREIKDLLRIL